MFWTRWFYFRLVPTLLLIQNHEKVKMQKEKTWRWELESITQAWEAEIKSIYKLWYFFDKHHQLQFNKFKVKLIFFFCRDHESGTTKPKQDNHLLRVKPFDHLTITTLSSMLQTNLLILIKMQNTKSLKSNNYINSLNAPWIIVDLFESQFIGFIADDRWKSSFRENLHL